MVKADQVSVDELQAAFIYKFTNFISWPIKNNSQFKILVIKNNDVYSKLQKTFDNKTVNKLKVNVTYSDILSPTYTKDKDIMIIYSNHEKDLDSVHGQKENSILTISQGISKAIINFFIDENENLRFEINNQKAKELGIDINSRLLNLAKTK